jgi:putative NADH-flavin reductase
MKLAVVAANGRVGRLVVKEAADRGFDVTAFVRSDNKTAAAKVVQKDLMDLEPADLAGFDAVVDAFGTWNPEEFSQQTTTSQHLCDVLSGTDTRLLIVGGAGSLYVNPEHTLQLLQTPEFPAEYVAMATSQADELAALRKRDDVKWTFVSPAADFQAEGPRTGSYLLAGEEFTTNDRGESAVSYADYAIAMVDEIESGDHIQQRISVVGK